ncbi:hypothetical protein FPV67DRAFT_1670578 [Lyophyllum atratum]|nr:hypothetical protein FPV67DRAFT_1670578 [Lyophyllum atratum]
MAQLSQSTGAPHIPSTQAEIIAALNHMGLGSLSRTAATSSTAPTSPSAPTAPTNLKVQPAEAAVAAPVAAPAAAPEAASAAAPEFGPGPMVAESLTLCPHVCGDCLAVHTAAAIAVAAAKDAAAKDAAAEAAAASESDGVSLDPTTLFASPHTWYFVTIGREVGVFQHWATVKPLINSISNAFFRCCLNKDEAEKAFTMAEKHNLVQKRL